MKSTRDDTGPKRIDESGAVIRGNGGARKFAYSFTSLLLYASAAVPRGYLDWYEYPT
jgi:hypothetical protein